MWPLNILFRFDTNLWVMWNDFKQVRNTNPWVIFKPFKFDTNLIITTCKNSIQTWHKLIHLEVTSQVFQCCQVIGMIPLAKPHTIRGGKLYKKTHGWDDKTSVGWVLKKMWEPAKVSNWFSPWIPLDLSFRGDALSGTHL